MQQAQDPNSPMHVDNPKVSRSDVLNLIQLFVPHLSQPDFAVMNGAGLIFWIAWPVAQGDGRKVRQCRYVWRWGNLWRRHGQRCPAPALNSIFSSQSRGVSGGKYFSETKHK